MTSFSLLFIQSPAMASALSNRIDLLANNAKHNPNIGIEVKDLTKNRVLYRRNSTRLFHPASTLKNLSAITALTYLKPRFKFRTDFITYGKVDHKGVLASNMYLRFSGDPDLTSKNIAEMVWGLHEKGIKRIIGNLVLDDGIYDTVNYPAGMVWDDLTYGYGGPLSSIIIDKNKFLVKLHPSRNGHKAKITTKLPNGVVSFSNDLITHRQCHAPILIYSSVANHYNIRGCLSHNRGRAQYRELAMRNPHIYAKVLLHKLLKEQGIQLSGKIVFGQWTPEQGVKHTTLVHHESPALPKVIKEMLKKSDNLIANSLFKQVGHQYNNSQGSWTNSKKAVASVLTPLTHIDFKALKIDDGAGISRYDLVSPSQMIALLTYGYRQPTIWKHLYPALPIMGTDGTLEWRMRNIPQNKRIHAKTGTMTGITCLAGYVLSANKHELAFDIAINGFVDKKRIYTKLEDQIVEWLATHKA